VLFTIYHLGYLPNLAIVKKSQRSKVTAMSEDHGKDYTLEGDSELRFEIEQKDAKVLVSVS